MIVRRISRALVSAAALLALVPVAVSSAAAPPCPIATDDVVSSAVGSPVHGGILTDFISDNALDTGPDKTVCMWDADNDATITLSRQTNAFGAGGYAGPAELVATSFRLPAEAVAEVDALRSAGVADIKLPTFQLSPASGVGDAAVWIFQNDPSINVTSGGLVVQRGVDAYVVGIIGLEESLTRTQAQALAHAVLGS
jgi:hypothetical protein